MKKTLLATRGTYILIFFLLGSVTSNFLLAQCSSSDIDIEIITAYNFIDDSNIQTPAGTPVTAAHIGAKFCNTSASARSDVFAYVGTYTGSGNGTPGTYESTTWPGLTGTFAIEHSANKSDAARYIGDLDPGECVVQYWLIEYPNLDDAGNPVYGACSDETDDLKLNYDIWTTFSDGGSPAANCYNDDTRSATIRCEITASANKIWPNGDNKVPDEYVQTLTDQGYNLGWDLDENLIAAGQVKAVNGIWYDLGNVNQGFDNDGDFVPDYNAWMQPVGNPELYDPNCFRLVKTHGFLIVKSNTDGDIVIPFEDQLYFENLPPSNTGVVGVVFYEYIAINGPCTATLTPYQEVASGSNNEKFNADFGTGAPLTSLPPTITIDKSVDATVLSFPPDPGTLTYTLQVNNAGPETAGAPQYGVPIVISDAIPAGTTFKAGSMSTTSGGYSFRKLYSTDNGATWVTTEPTPASSITDIQWWMNEPLAASDNASVTFQVEVASGTVGALVHNTAGVSIANNPPLDEDDATTLIAGTNSIGDTVFVDNGVGGGTHGNGIADGSEPGIPNVTIYLYYDIDADGTIGSNDILYDSMDTDANGQYLFQNLADGDYIISLDKSDVIDNPTYAGHNLTTDEQFTTNVSGGASYLDADFGFAPPLSIEKTISTSGTIHEGQEVTYSIEVTNHLAGQEGGGSSGEEVIDTVQTNNVADFDAANTLRYEPGGNIITQNWTVMAQVQFKNPIGSEAIYCLKNGTDNNSGLYLNAITDGSLELRRGAVGFSTSVSTGIISAGQLYHIAMVRDVGGEITVYVDGLPVAFSPAPTDPTTNYTKLLVGSYYWEDGISANNLNGEEDNVQLFDRALSSTEINTAASSSCIDVSVPNLIAAWDFETINGSNEYLGLVEPNEVLAPVFSPILQASGNAATCIYTYPNNSEDASSSFDPRFTMYDVKLEDNFNTAELEFVSATIPPDSDSPAGKLTWNDIGPINPGETKTIEATFKAKYGNAGSTINNEADITNSAFHDGTPGNTPSDNVDFTLSPGASISGLIWSDIATGTAGWVGATGYEAGTDSPIPGTTVNLMVCAWNGDVNNIISSSDPDLDPNDDCAGQKQGTGGGAPVGVWAQLQTTTTDDNGAYIFDGLADNGFYYIEVDATSLPTGITQSAEANDNQTPGGQTCGTCDNIWGTPVSGNGGGPKPGDLNGTNFNIVDPAASEDITNVNFGYNVPPVLYGNVWEDVDGDGNPDPYTRSLSGWTVSITGPGCSPCNTTTDANGDYRFENLSAGSYTITVAIPGGWTQTFETDGTVDNSTSKTLVGGEISGSWDFGFTNSGTSTIGDVVFHDLDGNGTQDASDEGIPNIDVLIIRDVDEDGIYTPGRDIVLETVTTNATGVYTSSPLPAGEYLVVVDETDTDMPVGFQTADPDESGAACSTCDGTGSTTLDGTASVTDQDFGYQPVGTGSIGDVVWNDRDGDGAKIATESGLDSVNVILYADLNGDGVFVVMDTVVTDSIGGYLFENLPDGAYRIDVDTNDPDIPAALTSSNYSSYNITITNGQTDNATLSCTDCPRDADFGFSTYASIGDMVYWDADENGTQDWNETGIGDITVNLYNEATGNLVATTTTSDGTDGNPVGYYIFENLSPADYVVVVDDTDPDLNGAAQTADPDSDGLTCSDPDLIALGYPACDHRDTLNVGYGNSRLSADFGYKPAGVIGDFIWNDVNGDGIQDEGEPGLANVPVYLCTSSSPCTAASGDLVASTQTDFDGLYTFSNIPDGNYNISITPPAGYNPTTGGQSVGATTTTLTMAGNVVTNIGGSACTDCDLAVDFSLKIAGTQTISGNICIDVSPEDGLCDDPGDTNLEGEEVHLYRFDSGSWVYSGSVQTDATGAYQFDGLPDGQYVVSLSTENAPFDKATLETDNADSPGDINDAGTSVYHNNLTISGAPIADVDFAFSLPDLDFGDLPAGYKVTLADNGPRHETDANWYLGTGVDGESDGANTANADSDDQTGGADDGTSFQNLGNWTPGSNQCVEIDYTVPSGETAYIIGWIDWGQDGSFSGDMIVNAELASGSSPATICFDIPANVSITDPNHAVRFRLFDQAQPFPALAYNGTPSGATQRGEVEDLLLPVTITGLPVELSRFEGQVQGCNTVITWFAESEDNFSHYELEWSGDGRNFQEIASIDGLGSTINGQAYQYFDEQAAVYNYYRLKMIDIDGTSEYSKVIYIETNCKDEYDMMVYPNPIAVHRKAVNIKFYSERAETDIFVLDMLGRVMISTKLGIDPGWNTVRLDVGHLSPGTYFIKQPGDKGAARFVIQK